LRLGRDVSDPGSMKTYTDKRGNTILAPAPPGHPSTDLNVQSQQRLELREQVASATASRPTAGGTAGGGRQLGEVSMNRPCPVAPSGASSDCPGRELCTRRRSTGGRRTGRKGRVPYAGRSPRSNEELHRARPRSSWSRRVARQEDRDRGAAEPATPQRWISRWPMCCGTGVCAAGGALTMRYVFSEKVLIDFS
jgi:hypothetical protein